MRSLGKVDRFVAGARGEPGKRTFYIELEAAAETYWFVIEKQQAAVLAHRSLDLVRLMREDQPVAGDAPAVAVAEPDAIVFRVGEIAIAHSAGEDEIVVTLRSTDDEDEPVEFTTTVEQLEVMALAAVEAVAGGRPLCPRCNLPLDPDGHVCPASNGDLRTSRQ